MIQLLHPHLIRVDKHQLQQQLLVQNLQLVVFLQKKKDTCNHKVVFGKHYNKNLWEKYAMIVKHKKYTVEIDPNYVA